MSSYRCQYVGNRGALCDRAAVAGTVFCTKHHEANDTAAMRQRELESKREVARINAEINEMVQGYEAQIRIETERELDDRISKANDDLNARISQLNKQIEFAKMTAQNFCASQRVQAKAHIANMAQEYRNHLLAEAYGKQAASMQATMHDYQGHSVVGIVNRFVDQLNMGVQQQQQHHPMLLPSTEDQQIVPESMRLGWNGEQGPDSMQY